MPKYYVVSEDGDSMQVDTLGPQEAAQAAVNEWQLEADPGYGFKVFAAHDAKDFKFALIVVPA